MLLRQPRQPLSQHRHQFRQIRWPRSRLISQQSPSREHQSQLSSRRQHRLLRPHLPHRHLLNRLLARDRSEGSHPSLSRLPRPAPLFQKPQRSRQPPCHHEQPRLQLRLQLSTCQRRLPQHRRPPLLLVTRCQLRPLPLLQLCQRRGRQRLQIYQPRKVAQLCRRSQQQLAHLSLSQHRLLR